MSTDRKAIGVSTEDEAPKRNEKGHWLPGVSGSGGRPKGSRNRLGEAFLAALADDFDKHGENVIQTVRLEDPTAYLRVCASILPKELTVKVDPLEELSDADLDRYIKQLAAALSLEVGVGEGVAGETPATTH